MNHQGSKPPPYEASSSHWVLPQYQEVLYPQVSYQSTPRQVPTYQYYFPGTTAPVTPPAPSYQPQPTYVTNYIYQAPPIVEPVKIVEPPKEFDWIPAVFSTASHLTGRAFIAGHDADGSPFWIIKSKVLRDIHTPSKILRSMTHLSNENNTTPGKFSVRDNKALVTSMGKEKQVDNFEVLCIHPELVQWVPASNGKVPPKAVEGGKRILGGTLYIGRVSHRGTLTPGFVDKRLQCCVIGFGGSTAFVSSYEVLCRV